MFGLTTLGAVHTAISLVALASGFLALWREREISLRSSLGRTYVVTTALTAATALGIFQHGGFGPPHMLAILTLLALAIGCLAAFTGLFGGWSRYAQAVSFSTTIFFHLVPAFTETLTRLPLGAPVLPNAEAPELKAIAGVLLLLLVVGLVLQLRWLRAQAR